MYLIQVSICWIFFFALYYVAFKRLTFFNQNRWYLLISLTLGLILPILAPYITVYKPVIYTTYINSDLLSSIVIIQNSDIEPVYYSYKDIAKMVLWAVYASGVMFLLLRMWYGLQQIYIMYTRGQKHLKDGIELVQLDSDMLPFSFFNKVFFGRKFTESELERVMKHELVHINQYHTLDILFVEVLKCFFWFNPVIGFYKRSLKQAHEYIADHFTTHGSLDREYIHLLLNTSMSSLQQELTNQFFNTEIKNRIDMMIRNKSAKSKLLNYILILPTLLVISYAFASNAATYIEENNLLQNQELSFNTISSDTITPPSPAPIDNLMKYLTDSIQYPKEALAQGVEGKVMLEIKISKGSKVYQAKVLNPVNEILKKAAINHVLALNKRNNDWFKNNILHGNNEITVNMPIEFSINKYNKEGYQYGTPQNAKLAAIKNTTFNSSARFFTDAELDLELSIEKKDKSSNEKFIQFIYKNIKYPAEARNNDHRGMTIVDITIDVDGKIKNPKIIKSVHPTLDASCLEMLNSMSELPNPWIPAMLDGKAVASKISIPITFKLMGDNSGLNKDLANKIESAIHDAEINKYIRNEDKKSEVVVTSFSTKKPEMVVVGYGKTSDVLFSEEDKYSLILDGKSINVKDISKIDAKELMITGISFNDTEKKDCKDCKKGTIHLVSKIVITSEIKEKDGKLDSKESSDQRAAKSIFELYIKLFSLKNKIQEKNNIQLQKMYLVVDGVHLDQTRVEDIDPSSIKRVSVSDGQSLKPKQIPEGYDVLVEVETRNGVKFKNSKIIKNTQDPETKIDTVVIKSKNKTTLSKDVYLRVDGVHFENTEISDLDPNEIKSVEVFKDKSLIGKNIPKGYTGLVEITTKNGVKFKNSKIIKDAQKPKMKVDTVVLVTEEIPGKEKNIIVVKRQEKIHYILNGDESTSDEVGKLNPDDIKDVHIFKGKLDSFKLDKDVDGVVKITTKNNKAGKKLNSGKEPLVDFKRDLKATIYPNPLSKNGTLEIKTNDTKTPITILWYNILGKEILKLVISDHKGYVKENLTEIAEYSYGASTMSIIQGNANTAIRIID